MTSVHQKSIKIAADAAKQAHRGQFRKDGKTLFIVHPERVAERVKFFGGDHIGIIAAWLHDVMEDCDGGENIVHETLQGIELPHQERDEIFAIVSSLTKNSAKRKNQRDWPIPWKELIRPRARQSSSNCVTGWIT